MRRHARGLNVACRGGGGRARGAGAAGKRRPPPSPPSSLWPPGCLPLSAHVRSSGRRRNPRHKTVETQKKKTYVYALTLVHQVEHRYLHHLTLSFEEL